MKIFTSLLKVCAAALIMFGLSMPAQAIVYTLSNEVFENRVIAFDISKRSGKLYRIGSFDTQGTGTGATIGNQAALTTDASDRWLFATNAGDGSLTSFRLQPKGLEFVNKVPSGGHSAISVAVYGTLVYVLNEGSGEASDSPAFRYDNISAFRFTAGGVLEAIPGSTRILDNTQLTSPAQVGFNKSGTVVLITEKATNTLTTFLVQKDGMPAKTPLKRPSAVPTPFGFEFGDRDFVYITEANGGGQGVTASYRVDRESGEVSSLVDRIDQGDATCWTVLSSDQTVGYSVNTGSGTVSLYRLNFDGTLRSFFGRRNFGFGHFGYGYRDQTDLQISTGTGPRDAVLTQNNQNLAVLNNGDSEIRVFKVSRNGSLRRGGTASIPPSATGLIAR